MKRIYLFLLLVMSVVSCAEDNGMYDGGDTQKENRLLSFTAASEAVTKVSIAEDGTTAWEDGDCVLVYVPSTGISGKYVYSAEDAQFTPQGDAEPVELDGNTLLYYPEEYFNVPAGAGASVSMSIPETVTATEAGRYGYRNPMMGIIPDGSLSDGKPAVTFKNIGSVLRVNLSGTDADAGTIASVKLTASATINGTGAVSWSSDSADGLPVLTGLTGMASVTADFGDYDMALPSEAGSVCFFLPAGVETELTFDIISDKNEYVTFFRGTALTAERARLYDVTKNVSFSKTIVEKEQSKYYMTAAEDLLNMVTDRTAGMKVLLTDSKFYAVGERVLSVSYTVTDGYISGAVSGDKVLSTEKSVTMTWASADPVNRPAVGKDEAAGEFGIHCFPGTFEGKFVVVTNRYTYEFTKAVTLTKGAVTDVVLDFAAPDVQPTRKVGVIGDSISTFDGQLCNREFAVYYPKSDCDVTLEKTWWWRVINEKMSCGELDVNNSWSGSKVIHEFKNGRYNKKPMEAGFVDRAYEFADPDIILIHGGTNDSNNKSPLGEYKWNLPIGQNDITTYRGAYIELIKKIQNRYEGVQIIIIVGDHLLTDYAESTIAIAEHFNLPYVDFATAANADGVLGDPASIEKYSGSHPTAAGFTYMVNKIYETCKDYLP